MTTKIKPTVTKLMTELKYAIDHNLPAYIVSIQEQLDSMTMTAEQTSVYNNLIKLICN